MKLLLFNREIEIKQIPSVLFTIFGIILFSKGITLLLFNLDPVFGKITQIQWYILYFISLFYVITNYKKTVQIIKKSLGIWILTFLCFISMLWSNDPKISLISTFELVGSTLFALFLATKYKLEKFSKVIFISFAVMCILSVFFSIMLPDLGVHQDVYHSGAWRGIFLHKNTLGRISILSSIFSLIYFLEYKKTSGLIFFILSVLLVILSTSSTALIMLIILIIVIPFFKFVRKTSRIIIPSLILVNILSGLVFYLVISNLSDILDLLGKDITLTGRTELWLVVWGFIEKRLFLGYGYNAFWLGWEGLQSNYIYRVIGWTPYYSHNGILELLLQVGLLGTTIFLIIYIKTFFKAVKLIILGKNYYLMLPLLYLFYELTGNITESDLLSINSIYWIIFVYFYFILSSDKGTFQK
ncbi:O-antigen ligase family protein [Aeribacillus sp. FSL M8-0235]|uniref:O-antigen ligase family protein n=1 Tax=Aeribacillus sp. FSL M8-0235 TaxID=2954576 RepID=UPI0030FAEE6D